MDSDDSDSDNDDMEIKVTGIYRGNHVNHDLFIKAGMETKVEAGLFRKSKSRYPLFPHFEEKIKFDEYGEFIKLVNPYFYGILMEYFSFELNLTSRFWSFTDQRTLL